MSGRGSTSGDWDCQANVGTGKDRQRRWCDRLLQRRIYEVNEQGRKVQWLAEGVCRMYEIEGG